MFTANIIIVMLMALELSQGNYKFIFCKGTFSTYKQAKNINV